MIIKGHGISSTSNISKFNDYLFKNEKNEEINKLQGSEEDIKNMFSDAKNAEHKNGCRHFMFSSKEELSQEQALKIAHDISKEYGQDPKKSVIINHTKTRTTSDSDKNHYHIILPNTDESTGKSYDFSFSKKRNEKLSRLAELENGHNLVKGRHNVAVFHQLLKEGKTEQAQKMQHLTEGDLPNSKYTSKGLEKGRKQGINKAQEAQNIKTLYSQSDSLKAFQAGLSEAGYELKPGNKPQTYIIEKNGILVGSANRLLSMKKEEFAEKYNKENLNNDTANTAEKANNAGSNIQTRKDSEQQHKPDNRLTDAGNGRITDTADIRPTSANSTATRNTDKIKPANRQYIAQTVAKTRINAGLGITTTSVDSDDKTATGAGIKAGNTVIQEFKKLQQIEEDIKKIFENLQKSHSFNRLSIKQKIAMKHVNDEIKKSYKTLKERPKVKSVRDIQKDLENKPLTEYIKSKKEKEQCEGNIKSLENKKYGFLGFLKKTYRDDKKTLKELQKKLPELSKNETDKNYEVGIKKRISYDEARSEQDKQIKKRDDYDKKNNIENVQKQLPILQNIKSDISINNSGMIDKINNGGLCSLIRDELEKINQQQEKQRIEREQKEKLEQNKKIQKSNPAAFKPRWQTQNPQPPGVLPGGYVAEQAPWGCASPDYGEQAHRSPTEA